MSAWTYGVIGLGNRDKKTMDAHRRKGQAICYRQAGDRCEVWQYSSRSWVPVPERSIDLVALCELIGEKAPGNRSIASRTRGMNRLPTQENNQALIAPADAAVLLRRSPTRIYRWIQSGCPAYAVRVAGQRRIRVLLREVIAWATEQGWTVGV